MNADHYWFKFLVTIPEQTVVKNKKHILERLASCFFPMFSVKCQLKTWKPATKAAGETTITFAEEGKVGYSGSTTSVFFKQHQKQQNMSSRSLTFWCFDV